MHRFRNKLGACPWAAIFGLAIVVILVTTGAVLAAEAGHGGGQHGGGGGLPQLNTHTYVPQLVWLAGTFISLYLILSFVALPPVANLLETRDGKISYDLTQAEALKNQSKEVLAAVERQLAEARAQAQAALARTAEEISNQTHVALAEIDTEILGRVKDAEITIVAAKQKAINDINSAATSVASDVVGRLVGTAPDQSDVAAAVNSVIRERA